VNWGDGRADVGQDAGVLEKSALGEETLERALATAWDVRAASIEFLPIGNDNRSWAYDVRTERGERLFLKVRSGGDRPASLLVPRVLHDRGVRGVVPPVPTGGGALTYEVDGHGVILYPFVAGQNAMRSGMSDRQWIAYGEFVAALHATELPETVDAEMPTETYRTHWVPLARALSERVATERFDDPSRRELAAFWRAHQDEITALTDRTEQLADVVRRRRLPHVVCHADIHTANLLVEDGTGIVVVDWDEVTLAPRERDLVFVVGGPFSDDTQEARFREGYGEYSLDWPALAYYRYLWVVSDIAANGEAVLELDEFGEANRQRSVEGLVSLWEPGNTIEIARDSERHLR
jgi:spectinomycin phosphotransferase